MRGPNNNTSSEVVEEVLAAEGRIRSHIRETPLEYSAYLSRSSGGRVYLKLENLQLTGSFKLRGAMNKLLSLTEEQKSKGIVTASSGNHGAAVAYALKRLDMTGTIFLPENTAQAKVESLRLAGADIQFYGDDCVKAEIHAREIGQKNGLEFISPYNDLKIIGGQGTVGLELERKLDGINIVLVPVGGGGLISGVAGYLKDRSPKTEIFGCQPQNSAVMFESIKAGRIVDITSLPTLSDGSAGGIEPGTVTFALCRELVDDFILVSEAQIREAILCLLEQHHMLVEGAAALSVAAFLQRKNHFKAKTAVLILSGAKIGLDTLRKIVCRGSESDDKNL